MTVRRELPGNPASAVYGTIVVAGQLAIEGSTGSGTGTLVASVVATVVVFWLAHAYTDSLAESMSAGRAPGAALRHALRVEWPIVESALLPLLGLLVAVLVGAGPETGALAALLVAVAELVGWAVLAARRSSLSRSRTVAFAFVAGLLGVVLIALKYAIH